MSRKYKFHNPDGVYFITFAVQGWVDVFTRNEYKNILVDYLAYCQKNKGLELFASCIMTNHVHLIARAEEGQTLSDILRDYKKFTSKAVLQAINENQRESRKEWLLKKFETVKAIGFGGQITNRLNFGAMPLLQKNYITYIKTQLKKVWFFMPKIMFIVAQ